AVVERHAIRLVVATLTIDGARRGGEQHRTTKRIGVVVAVPRDDVGVRHVVEAAVGRRPVGRRRGARLVVEQRQVEGTVVTHHLVYGHFVAAGCVAFVGL